MPYDHGRGDLRASDADREEAVERLRTAALEGRLDSDELEDRIASAYGARWCSELEALTLDVTPPPARVAPPVFVRSQRRVNLLAIASIVLAVMWMGWLGSFAAVVTGHVALRQISRSGGAQTGRTAAMVGLTIGYLALAVLLLVVVFSPG